MITQGGMHDQRGFRIAVDLHEEGKKYTLTTPSSVPLTDTVESAKFVAVDTKESNWSCPKSVFSLECGLIFDDMF